jgi:hypothetical protein
LKHYYQLFGFSSRLPAPEIPQFILEAGIARKGTIAVTQPRRVAAITLASRVAHEQATNVGGLVGYAVRFEERAGPYTKIKYMTDGMLGRELLSDPMLRKYSVIIVDEAHERTLRTDLLLTSLKGILKARNTNAEIGRVSSDAKSDKKGKFKELHSLKVIVMSATIDAERFSQFFDKYVLFLFLFFSTAFTNRSVIVQRLFMLKEDSIQSIFFIRLLPRTTTLTAPFGRSFKSTQNNLQEMSLYFFPVSHFI